MTASTSARRGVFASIGAGISTLRTFTANVLFLGLLVVVLVAILSSSEDSVVVPDRAALVLRLDGPVVEARPDLDPIALLLNDEDSEPPPIVLRDIVEGLKAAAEDDRIEALVLDLGAFPGAAPATLRAVGDALAEFSASGKPILTGADFLSQSQYLLASHSTYLYLNPVGQVMLRGFASQPAYFASALEKLRINVHVFRVGEYKSAVEPFIRDDMSEAARDASRALVEGLWGEYRDRIAANRGLPAQALDGLLDDMPARLRAVDGDFARLALETGLVDELLTRDAFEARMVDLVGADEDDESFRQVGLRAYLNNERLQGMTRRSEDVRHVGVVVAEGNITGGRESTEIGEATAALIRQARKDDDVAALVLRVNSPGGSVFFSEVVRRELELAQLQGKPVVASMGGLAASGGYWISATSDLILAEPDTITGSIGIFGLLPTFEDSADALGVHSDGVGTHALSGAGNPLEPINPAYADLLQQSVEQGYERFIDLVARGRQMTPEEVDTIAQGRVWLGRTALELGLVDRLGGLDAAVEAAAGIAGLDSWEMQYVEAPQDARDQFLARLFASPIAGALGGALAGDTLRTFERINRWAGAPLALLATLEDPENLYALCGLCPRGN